MNKPKMNKLCGDEEFFVSFKLFFLVKIYGNII